MHLALYSLFPTQFALVLVMYVGACTSHKRRFTAASVKNATIEKWRVGDEEIHISVKPILELSSNGRGQPNVERNPDTTITQPE